MFNPERLSLIVQPIGEGGIRFYSYPTDDAEATVTAAGYATNAADYGLRAYDLIFVTPITGAADTYILAVDAIDADGHATLASPGPIGDLLKSIYDPNNIEGDAFDMANMVEAADAKVMTAAERTAIGNLEDVIVTPYDYGASPSDAMSVDQSAAVQAMIDAIVASWDSSVNRYRREASLGGRIWTCDSGIDLTQIRNPGLVVRDGAIYSKATGAVAWDMSGANSVTLIDIHVWGDETSQPGVGILLSKADSGSGTFPDAKQHKLVRVSANGYFSKSAYINFSSEVSELIGCTFQNKSRSTSAYAGILCANAATLDDYVSGVTSSFATIPDAADGTQSNIIHNLNQAQFLRVSDVTLTCTGVTKADPAVLSFTPADLVASELANDDKIYIYQFAGMTELNHAVYTVKNINTGAGTFELYDEAGTGTIDSTAFTTFTSGIVWNQTGPALLVSSVGDLKIDNGYFLQYGNVPIVFDLKNGGSCRMVSLRGQCEHSPDSIIRWDLPDATGHVFQGFEFDLVNANQTVSTALFTESGGGSGGFVRFDGFRLRVASLGASPTNGVFNDKSKYNINNADITLPIAAAWGGSTGFVAFDGKVRLIDTDNNTEVGDRTFTKADNGATSGPFVDVDRYSASPAASDLLGYVRFTGRNSADEQHVYAGVRAQITDATDGSEDARLVFMTSVAGVETTGPNITGQTLRLISATVANLPVLGAGGAGAVMWASDCRVFNGTGTQEGAGVGTGGLVTHNGTAWKIAGTNVTAVA